MVSYIVSKLGHDQGDKGLGLRFRMEAYNRQDRIEALKYSKPSEIDDSRGEKQSEIRNSSGEMAKLDHPKIRGCSIAAPHRLSRAYNF